MIHIKKILVPVDFSEASKKAVNYGLSLALEFNARVVLWRSIARPEDMEGLLRVQTEAGQDVDTGLVWMSHKRIENIPASKWPNVFNIVTLVPQVIQESLPLLEGVAVVEDHTTNGGSSDFLAKNGRGSSQTPQNGLANPRARELATTNGGSCQLPLAGHLKRLSDLRKTL